MTLDFSEYDQPTQDFLAKLDLKNQLIALALLEDDDERVSEDDVIKFLAEINADLMDSANHTLGQPSLTEQVPATQEVKITYLNLLSTFLTQILNGTTYDRVILNDKREYFIHSTLFNHGKGKVQPRVKTVYEALGYGITREDLFGHLQHYLYTHKEEPKGRMVPILTDLGRAIVKKIETLRITNDAIARVKPLGKKPSEKTDQSIQETFDFLYALTDPKKLDEAIAPYDKPTRDYLATRPIIDRMLVVAAMQGVIANPTRLKELFLDLGQAFTLHQMRVTVPADEQEDAIQFFRDRPLEDRINIILNNFATLAIVRRHIPFGDYYIPSDFIPYLKGRDETIAIQTIKALDLAKSKQQMIDSHFSLLSAPIIESDGSLTAHKTALCIGIIGSLQKMGVLFGNDQIHQAARQKFAETAKEFENAYQAIAEGRNPKIPAAAAQYDSVTQNFLAILGHEGQRIIISLLQNDNTATAEEKEDACHGLISETIKLDAAAATSPQQQALYERAFKDIDAYNKAAWFIFCDILHEQKYIPHNGQLLPDYLVTLLEGKDQDLTAQIIREGDIALNPQAEKYRHKKYILQQLVDNGDGTFTLKPTDLAKAIGRHLDSLSNNTYTTLDVRKITCDSFLNTYNNRANPTPPARDDVKGPHGSDQDKLDKK